MSQPEDPLLQALQRETHLEVLMPRMLSGTLQGNLLRLFTYMIRPRRILEIGTFTGYSAICMAQALQPGGRLHTIDINAEQEGRIRKYLKLSGTEDRVQLHLGEAARIIPTLQEAWDLVFIDADKENYSLYYDLVFPAVRAGGYLIADNVLWSGKVLQAKKDKETLAIHTFNEKIHADERVEPLLLPIRDGLMICRKK